MKININKMVKNAEDIIYKRELVEIPSISISVVRYIQIEEKFGIANRLFNVLYNDGIFDYVNARFLVPVFLLDAYSPDVEFPSDLEELDATGVYDMLVASNAMNEIYNAIGSEWNEVNEILLSLVKMHDREYDMHNSFESVLNNAMSKTPEEVSKMHEEATKIMQDENIRSMVSFKDRADA